MSSPVPLPRRVMDAGRENPVCPIPPGGYPILDSSRGHISHTGDPKFGQGIMGGPPPNLGMGAEKGTKRAS